MWSELRLLLNKGYLVCLDESLHIAQRIASIMVGAKR